jgi:hypothetical protein
MTNYAKVSAHAQARKDAEDRAEEDQKGFRMQVQSYFCSVQSHLESEIEQANSEQQKEGKPEVRLERDRLVNSEYTRLCIRLGGFGKQRMDIELNCPEHPLGFGPNIRLHLILEPNSNGTTTELEESFDMIQEDKQVFARRPDRRTSWPHKISAEKIAAIAVCTLILGDFEQGVNGAFLEEIAR